MRTLKCNNVLLGGDVTIEKDNHLHKIICGYISGLDFKSRIIILELEVKFSRPGLWPLCRNNVLDSQVPRGENSPPSMPWGNPGVMVTNGLGAKRRELVNCIHPRSTIYIKEIVDVKGGRYRQRFLSFLSHQHIQEGLG